MDNIFGEENMNFPMVEITPDMISRAKIKAKNIPRDIPNSILNGGGRLTGCIGEEVIVKIYGGIISPTYEYDVILNNGVFGEVKTKNRTVDYYREGFECTVAKANTKQKCQIYMFASINLDLKIGWAVGHIPKEDFFPKSRELKKGEIDGDNNFKVRADCFNIYSYLLEEAHFIEKKATDLWLNNKPLFSN